MSDWYNRDRDNNQNREGAGRRDRRDFGGRDRWRSRGDEQRSFDQRQPDPARGGYSGESFGGPDFTPQERNARDFRGEPMAGARGQDYGQRDREARFGDRSQERGPSDYDRPYSGQPYSGQQEYGRQADYDPSFQSYGGRSGSSDLGRYRSGPQRYGDDRSAVGANPAVQRVADGEADPAWRANMGTGEHRGRGPKNYIRSDTRIAEDLNDRLSDDPWLDASEIEVKVMSSEVTLTGVVQSREDKRRAEDLAEQVGGVKQVQNNLRIEPQSIPSARNTPPPVT